MFEQNCNQKIMVIFSITFLSQPLATNKLDLNEWAPPRRAAGYLKFSPKILPIRNWS